MDVIESAEILGRLTLEEKCRLLTGEGTMSTKGIPEKGVESIRCLDGGPGLNIEQVFEEFCFYDNKEAYAGEMLKSLISRFFDVYKLEKENKDTGLSDEEYELYSFLLDRLEDRCQTDEILPPACFPSGLLLGSTWNQESIEKVGEALAVEALAYDVRLLLGTPFANIIRDPRAGRAFEGYSEDPRLTAELSKNFVKGVQKKGVAANVKHLFANNQETNRMGINEIISERAIEEIYLPAFDACLKEGVATVMTAYNTVNGVRCTENEKLINDRIRNKLGYHGLFISDWNAVQNIKSSVKAGNDLAMPYTDKWKKLVSAVNSGELDVSYVDKAVENVIEFSTRYSASKLTISSAEEIEKLSDEAALKAALEGIVLLKNDRNVFPLRGRVSIIAEDKGYFYDCGTGSAGIDTSRKYSLYDELKHVYGPLVTLNTIDKSTQTLLVVVRTIGMEGNDKKTIKLPEKELRRIDNTLKQVRKLGTGIKVGVILNVAAPVDVSSFVDRVDGIFCTFLPGMMGTRALAKLLVGKECPAGRLPVTFPKRDEDMPTYLNFPGDGMSVVYGEDIYVGYRYYNTKKINVAFPFGYGLSYTNFEYQNMKVSEAHFKDKTDVSIEIKNTGRMTGQEVVQLYIRDRKSTLRKPERELKAFKKVKLSPGERQRVRFTLTRADFASYDADLGCWAAEEGEYDIIIARDAMDVVDSICVTGIWKSPYSYSSKSPLKELYEVDQIREKLYMLVDDLGLDRGLLINGYEYYSYLDLQGILALFVDIKRPDIKATLKVFDEEMSLIEKK